MRVIKDRKIVDDGWTLLAPDAPIPPSGDVIVSVAQWTAYNAALDPAAPAERSGKLGVVLHSDELPEQIEHLDRLRRSGALTEEEFQAKKAELLRRM
jgi:uncharacterized protein (DUF934 family)